MTTVTITTMLKGCKNGVGGAAVEFIARARDGSVIARCNKFGKIDLGRYTFRLCNEEAHDVSASYDDGAKVEYTWNNEPAPTPLTFPP